MENTEAPEDRAIRYRGTAAHLREQANALAKSQERADLLAIADQYEKLARRLDGAEDHPVAMRESRRVRGRQDSQKEASSDLSRHAAE